MDKFNSVDEQFAFFIKDIVSRGHQIDTRNARTLRLLNKTFVFDQTPLVTIRRTAWKNALREMEYFLKGSIHLDDLHDNAHKWWEPFCTHIPKSMPYSYGYQLRNRFVDSNEVVLVKKKDNYEDFSDIGLPKFDIIKNIEKKGPLSDKIFINNQGSKYKVLDKISSKKYKIQFLNTGFIKEVQSGNILKGEIADPYFPSVSYVGYPGIYDKSNPSYSGLAYQIWRNMLSRCYNEKDTGYRQYGEKGIFVSNRWRNFENFLNDLPKIHGFIKWLDNPSDYHLDKDYYGSKIYSKDTCVFLPQSYNTKMCPKGTYIEVFEKKTQALKNFFSRRDVEKYYNMSWSKIKRIIESPQESDLIKIKLKVPEKGFLYRKKIIHDQVSSMIDGVKNHPFSRRNIWTTWIPEDMESRIVNPTNCHNSLTQCFVDNNNKLHMTMVQRSADMMLGVPHNWIAQWAVLMWIANKCRRDVGTLTWIGLDNHIYPDHIDMAHVIHKKEFELRGGYKIPNLVYTPTSDEFKADDFSLDIKYEPIIKESLNMTV